MVGWVELGCVELIQHETFGMGCWDWDVDTLVGGERVERDLRWVGTLERERERSRGEAGRAAGRKEGGSRSGRVYLKYFTYVCIYVCMRRSNNYFI